MHLNFIFFHEALIFFNFRRSSFSLLRYVHMRMRKARCRNSQWLHYPDAFGCRLLLWRWTQSKFLSGDNRYIGVIYCRTVTDIILCVFSSFTYPQIILIWGNFVAFYMINLILSAIPSLQIYTIMFRLCGQPSYWITMAVSLLLFHYGTSFFGQFHYITVVIISAIWHNYSRYVVQTCSPPSWLLQ
jgi:hypothetical protein